MTARAAASYRMWRASQKLCLPAKELIGTRRDDWPVLHRLDLRGLARNQGDLFPFSRSDPKLAAIVGGVTRNHEQTGAALRRTSVDEWRSAVGVSWICIGYRYRAQKLRIVQETPDDVLTKPG